MSRFMFWTLAKIGKPVRGIPPRRTLHWLAQRAYGDVEPKASEYRWHWDHWGNRLLLHPHYHIDYSIIAFGLYDHRLHRFIDRFVEPGMVCLDVGAHIGSISLHLARRVGDDGVVHSFEPVGHLFDRVVENVKANRLERVIRAHRLAVSNRTGVDQIWEVDSAYTNQGMASLIGPEVPDLCRQQPVAVTTLDEFVERQGIDRIDFMKIDIQGAEPLLIEGGRQTLATLRPALYVEVSPDHLKELGRSSRSLLADLEQLGYELFEVRRDGRRGLRVSHETVAADYESFGLLAAWPRPAGTRTRGPN